MRYLPTNFTLPTQRVCRCCRRLLPITAFYEDKSVSPKLRSRYAARCIECVTTEKRRRYAANPQAGAALRKAQRERKKARDAAEHLRAQAIARSIVGGKQ